MGSNKRNERSEEAISMSEDGKEKSIDTAEQPETIKDIIELLRGTKPLGKVAEDAQISASTFYAQIKQPAEIKIGNIPLKQLSEGLGTSQSQVIQTVMRRIGIDMAVEMQRLQTDYDIQKDEYMRLMKEYIVLIKEKLKNQEK